MSVDVDGFVIPLPKDKVDAYRRIARKFGALWIQHGALEQMPFDGKRMFWGGFKEIVRL